MLCMVAEPFLAVDEGVNDVMYGHCTRYSRGLHLQVCICRTVSHCLGAQQVRRTSLLSPEGWDGEVAYQGRLCSA